MRPSKELCDAVSDALHDWHREAIQAYYPNQVLILGSYILDDDVIDRIANRPRIVNSVDVFRHLIPWGFGEKYGAKVVLIVSGICSLHPDPVQVACEEQEHRRLVNAANKEYRESLETAFQECYDAVYDVRSGQIVKKGPRNNQHLEEERKCQPFLALPRKTVGTLFLSMEAS